jgi:hypothetical protein
MITIIIGTSERSYGEINARWITDQVKDVNPGMAVSFWEFVKRLCE